MRHIATQAYAPYLERMAGRRPAPIDADYDAAVADSEAWVVELGGQVIGYLVLVARSDDMLLDNVAVLPSYQGRGAGRALLWLAEERATAAGYDRVSLYTHEVMVENQRLYERIGYVETHRADERGFSRVFYEKALGETASDSKP
jgi:ribosomal protein S18 acetylase RimI-like enzyme